ncbi:endopeptidase La [bacterium]|nr:endopeptidase La [bacterium]
MSEVEILENIMLLPTAPLKEGVLFPGMQTQMIFTRESSKAAVRASRKSQDFIFITAQKSPNIDNPTARDLFKMGVIAKVGSVTQDIKRDSYSVNVTAIHRARVLNWGRTSAANKAIIANVEIVEDEYDLTPEKIELMRNHLLHDFSQLISIGLIEQPENFLAFLRVLPPGQACDHIGNLLSASPSDKQKLLEATKISERIKITMAQVNTELQVAKIETDVITKTHKKMEKNMRENILRERLSMIQKELGELTDEGDDSSEYDNKLKKLDVGEAIKNKIKKELQKFRSTSSFNPESSYLRNWLDTVFELPWNKFSNDVLDLKKAEKILNESHYGLEEVKDRILEYIAVLRLHQDQKKVNEKPTILCFVGPPGVGKTSIGQSIAKALGRKFARISLGGVRDEAEIRGHRRTYVGAMAGRIINGLKQAGTSNPVFMLDEIDKMDYDYHGDPSAALLEVLDPSQNKTFEDHYLDMPYDLSKIIFIATANTTDIPEPLLDRMEIIRYAGYTVSEKMIIAQKYLLPESLANAGLKPEQVTIDEKILNEIIENYTKEAGVRELSRQLDKIMRKSARLLVANKKLQNIVVDDKKLAEFLGPQKFDVSIKNQENEVGVATGLAWTSVGGDVLFIEVATSEGKGELKLTGQLGDVMKESAQAAMTYVRSHAADFGLTIKKLDHTDIHLHVPEGAVPKDGPSAGVTIVTALVSALTGRPVKKDVAMTGEVTLRGKVLRIGGLKEKSIAAARAGCQTICIPWENQRDLVEIPEEIRKNIKFVPTKSVRENLEIALEPVAKKKTNHKDQATPKK